MKCHFFFVSSLIFRFCNQLIPCPGKKLMYEKELSMESSPLKCVDHRNHRNIFNDAILKNEVDMIECD